MKGLKTLMICITIWIISFLLITLVCYLVTDPEFTYKMSVQHPGMWFLSFVLGLFAVIAYLLEQDEPKIKES